MKEIVKYKKNIFKKFAILPFALSYKLSNSTIELEKFKDDLKNILDNFGQVTTREVILLHKNKLPPKTKRCAMEIMSIDKSITYSTSEFKNYENENITLQIILNLKKEKMKMYIDHIEKIIKMIEIAIKEKSDISIIKEKSDLVPNWILNYLKNNNLKKIKTTKLISAIQNYYKKIYIHRKKIKFEGELILSFSSQQTKKEYLINNNNPTYVSSEYKYSNDEKDIEIMVDSKNIKNFDNIISITPNLIMESINPKLNEIYKINNDFLKIEEPPKDAPTIGILDGAILDTSPFKNVIKVTSYLKNWVPNGHGEAVSSLAFMGDQLNNFDDGCDKFNIHLFEIFENNIGVYELIKRIDLAIRSNHQKIKVWNLSINSIKEDALTNGVTSWISWKIDIIQRKYDVIIIQSSGNKENSYQEVIKAPADAIRSLVVNAVTSKNSFKPTSYSLKGYYKYFTRKPDVSYFGGSEKEQVQIINNGKKNGSSGTSFAAPFIARKIAQLIYYENKSILEAKALIIHAAYMNKNSDGINNGWGVVPHNINDILGSNDHSIRLIFNENIDDTKTGFINIIIPQEQKNIQEYSVYITTINSGILDEKFNCEYVRSSINIKMGPLNENNKLIPSRRLKSYSALNLQEDNKAYEKDLIKFYGKWKIINCASDVITRKREGINVKKYGILAKIDKRMNVINKKIRHKLVCIVTLVHKDKKDKYNKFLLENKNYIENIAEIKFIGDLKFIKN